MPPIKPAEHVSLISPANPDPGSILVRSNADGVIANAEIDCTKENFNGQLPGGIIDVSNCSLIAIFLNINYAALTDVSLYVQFSNGLFNRKNFHYLTTGELSNGVIIVTQASWKFTTAGNLVVPIQNPGSNQMRISMSSTGIVTGSYALISVSKRSV